jgi:hypothetical protein
LRKHHAARRGEVSYRLRCSWFQAASATGAPLQAFQEGVSEAHSRHSPWWLQGSAHHGDVELNVVTPSAAVAPTPSRVRSLLPAGYVVKAQLGGQCIREDAEPIVRPPPSSPKRWVGNQHRRCQLSAPQDSPYTHECTTAMCTTLKDLSCPGSGPPGSPGTACDLSPTAGSADSASLTHTLSVLNH